MATRDGLRHHHIGEKQVDVFTMRGPYFQCFRSIRSSKNSGIAPAPNRNARGSRRRQGSTYSLVTELSDTRECLKMLAQLNGFENSVFGPDFTIGSEEMELWAKSGCWFCAAVTGQAVVGRPQILSMLSVLITNTSSRDQLLAGQYSESQLQPWDVSQRDQNPVVYLASVIGAASEHLTLMYDSLLRDLREFRSSQRIAFHSGFGIASGPAGFNHMARNGFRHLEGFKYRDHYPLMVIDAKSAATRFWQRVLSSETPITRRDVEKRAKCLTSVAGIAIAS